MQEGILADSVSERTVAADEDPLTAP